MSCSFCRGCPNRLEKSGSCHSRYVRCYRCGYCDHEDDVLLRHKGSCLVHDYCGCDGDCKFCIKETTDEKLKRLEEVYEKYQKLVDKKNKKFLNKIDKLVIHYEEKLHQQEKLVQSKTEEDWREFFG